MNKCHASPLGTNPGLLVDQAHAPLAQVVQRRPDIVDLERNVV
jgi:hypothetical protein